MGSNGPARCAAFCETCGHGVLSMGTHIQTKEHKRNLRRQDGKLRRRKPRVPTFDGIARTKKEDNNDTTQRW